MRIAFFMSRLSLPPERGPDAHVTGLARALADRGHEVKVYSQQAKGAELLGLPYARLELDSSGAASTEFGPLRRRVMEYLGVTREGLDSLRREIAGEDFDACVYATTEGLAWLAGVEGRARIWYPADDPVLQSAARRRKVLVTGAYEFLFRDCCDFAWVVSETDRRSMSRLLGVKRVVNIPNGVDADYFAAQPVTAHPHRIAFWGNLSYRPNRNALQWFLPNVWAPLKQRTPDAEFLVIGRDPDSSIRALCDHPGVRLMPDVPDLRPLVCSAPIAVFPMRIGTGINNKMLEGASMGRALLASPRVVADLYEPAEQAWLCCERSEEWLAAIEDLFANADHTARLGTAARRWIEAHYRWDRAASQAEESLQAALALPASG